jgi:Rrf2 family protein
MLSATAEHALRAVLFLAQQPGGAVTSADDIADAIGAPRNYLSKTLNALTKAGITASVPGRRGGFTLAIAAGELTLHHLVSVFEGAPASRRCLLGDHLCAPDHPCAAHQRWTAIDRAADAGLRSTTVADLLST